MLLERLGLDGDRRQSVIVNWAAGLPLSLRLGADRGPRRRGVDAGADTGALHAHLRRIAEAALEGPYAGVFALGCVARTVTGPLIGDVLPELDAPAALRWLANSGFADSRAGGVALHETVRRHLRDELRRRDPGLERELRAKVADSLHAREGDLALTIDLADLVEDPAVRAGYSWDGGFDHHVSAAPPPTTALAPDAATRAFFAHEPEHVLVARDAAGEPAGYAIVYTSENATELALRDPRLGPWLRHAPANAIVWRDSVNLDPRPALARAGAAEHVGDPRCGPAQPALRVPADRPVVTRRARLQRRGRGARTRPSLDVDGWECHILDYGPGGLLGAQRDHVHRELGVARTVDPEAVRDALRNARPVAERSRARACARPPTAPSATRPTSSCFAQVLLRGYFDPATSHEAAARELHLSRAAYFRRLRSASERVAAVARYGVAGSLVSSDVQRSGAGQ